MARTPAKKTQTTEVVEYDDIDVFDDAGLGNENITSEDVLIPRLKLAQGEHKETKKNRPEYIEGLEVGDAFNSATREVFKLPIKAVAVAYNRRYIEWVPISKGGGLVNADHHRSIMDEVDEDGYLPNGNELADTPEHFLMVIDEKNNRIRPMVLSLASSGWKTSRAWNTLIREIRIKHPKTGAMVNPARFYGIYNMDAVDESNDKGDWKGWKVTYDRPVLELGEFGAEIYREARLFHEQIKEGLVKAEIEEPTETGGDGAKDVSDAM